VLGVEAPLEHPKVKIATEIRQRFARTVERYHDDRSAFA